MIHSIMGSILEIALGLGLVVLLYQTFLSDFVDEKRKGYRDNKSKHENIEKIARVKLVSDDQKDIEKFITDNAQYLSDEMVGQLVARIEIIKNDRIITADDILKKRIDSLETEEEEPAVMKRASRKR